MTGSESQSISKSDAVEPFAEEEPACGLSRRLRGKRARYIQTSGFFQRIRHSKCRAARCHFIQVHLRGQRGPSFHTSAPVAAGFLTQSGEREQQSPGIMLLCPQEGSYIYWRGPRVWTHPQRHTQAHPQDLTGVIHRSKPRPHTSR